MTAPPVGVALAIAVLWIAPLVPDALAPPEPTPRPVAESPAALRHLSHRYRGSPAVEPTVDADRARQEARRILSEARFRPRKAPRPFEGLFRRLGGWLVGPVRTFFNWLGRRLPDVGSLPWFLLALAVVAAAVVVTLRLSGERGRQRFGRGGGRGGETTPSPAELERQAEEAERRGDLEEALRLRFRAGLLRLDGVGAIELRPGLTNAAAARVLSSRRFDALAGDFDEVVYGGRAATGGDLEGARAGWPQVLKEARAP